MPRHQRLGDKEAKNGIAEEFELLVVAEWRIARASLVGMRTMRERAPEQLRMGEPVADSGFERCQLRLHRRTGYLPPFALAASSFTAVAAWRNRGSRLGCASSLSTVAIASSFLPLCC